MRADSLIFRRVVQVPRHIRVAGDPNRLSFTLNYPPFVAVSVGDKYLLTFDTTRVNEDLGLTFPEDYGVIAGFQWLPNLVLLVGLTNGYMVTVDFGALIKLQQSHKLPDRVSAMGTSRVFNEYLQDVSAFYTANTGQRVACCGDTQVKIVHRTGVELEVHLEVDLDRKPVIGHFLDKVVGAYAMLCYPAPSCCVAAGAMRRGPFAPAQHGVRATQRSS